jgi:TRAP transporter TAXI family solute receptor
VNHVERVRRAKWIIAIASLVSLVALIALMSWLRPGVPKVVTILTGAEGTRVHYWAEKYADYFEAHGVRTKIVETAGSVDILRRFRDADAATLGFMQSGVEGTAGLDAPPKDLGSLGSLYYEPTWFIVRSDAGIEDVPDLEGKRVYWGEKGSDARAAAYKLFDAYGVRRPALDPVIDALTSSDAAAALVDGTLDAAIFSGATASAEVRQLLVNSAVRPISAQHAEVFTRVNPDVGALRIPQGLFSLGEMIPREDVTVVAPAMNLVAKDSLHPAIVDLALDAATRLHRGATLLSRQGEFPSEKFTSLPMNDDAVHYYDRGPSGFRKYLPFWLASLVDQIIVIGLPFFLVLSTVFKGIPVYMEWKIKLDLLKFYRRLAVVEKAPQHVLDECMAELAAIETESGKLRLPGIHLPVYFEFRQTIHDMRDRLERGW